MKIINVILSGGVGSRLWPLSRKARPKQYLPIFEGKTLFQRTATRNQEFCDSILVVGNSSNYRLSERELSDAEIQGFQQIIEACPRNTAAAIAFAAFSAHEDDILFVTPSDHLIQADGAYGAAVIRAIQLAKEGFLVTFGLQPTHPETGFGYIEARGEEVLSFREKPDLDQAREFLQRGNFYWNSGMFCFQAGVYLSELKAFESEVYHASKKAWEQAQEGKLDQELSLQIPSISVDYAVMERSQKVKVVPSLFQWSDMGSFESIYEYLESHGHPKDENGNMVLGSDLHTEFTGMKNTLLIQTSDAILVLQREKSQEVKKVYERLELDRPDLV
jgi:mannose-1-phosphate guanylyltransferase